MCKTIIHYQTHHPTGDKNIYNACVDLSYIARSLHILKTKWAQIPCPEYFYVQINSSSNSPCQTLLKRSPFGSTLKILSHTLKKSKKNLGFLSFTIFSLTKIQLKFKTQLNTISNETSYNKTIFTYFSYTMYHNKLIHSFRTSGNLAEKSFKI